jgi:hypothetical protein
MTSDSDGHERRKMKGPSQAHANNGAEEAHQHRDDETALGAATEGASNGTADSCNYEINGDLE